jgi:VanZ family protein
MKRWARATFSLSGLFLCFFLFGLTEIGQTFLRGRIPQNAGHSQLDDIYMGAGLTPWVYGLAPCVLLAFVGTILLVSNRLRHRW